MNRQNVLKTIKKEFSDLEWKSEENSDSIIIQASITITSGKFNIDDVIDVLLGVYDSGHIRINFLMNGILPSYEAFSRINKFNEGNAFLKACIDNSAEYPFLRLICYDYNEKDEHRLVIFVKEMLDYLCSDEVLELLEPLAKITD